MNLSTKKWFIPGIILSILILISLFYVIAARQSLTYEQLKIDQAPATIYETYESQKTEQGFSVTSYDRSNYILITMGEVPTGGYSIDVQDVYTHDDTIIVKTRFIEPKPEDLVIMVISYPTSVVKIPQTDQPIQVLANGKKLVQLH